MIGLPREREFQIRLDADHSKMCRFDLSLEDDRDNYEYVEGHLTELCSQALAHASKYAEEQGEGADTQEHDLPVISMEDPRDDSMLLEERLLALRT